MAALRTSYKPGKPAAASDFGLLPNPNITVRGVVVEAAGERGEGAGLNWRQASGQRRLAQSIQLQVSVRLRCPGMLLDGGAAFERGHIASRAPKGTGLLVCVRS